MWSTSLSTDASGIHLQMQKCLQNTCWEWTGVPDQWKRIYRTTQNSVGMGKNRSVSRTGPALGWWGNWSRGLIPTSRQLSESEEKHLRLRVKQLLCSSLNRMGIRQSLLQPYTPWGRNAAPLKGRVAGSWSLGMWRNPRVRAAVDCREISQGDVREEIVGRNACGGKLGSHGSKVILLSHV